MLGGEHELVVAVWDPSARMSMSLWGSLVRSQDRPAPLLLAAVAREKELLRLAKPELADAENGLLMRVT